MDTNEIKQIVREIRKNCYKSTAKKLYEEKYPDFAASFPKLFINALDKNFDLKHLDFMLDMLDKVKNEANPDLDAFDKCVYSTLQNEFMPEQYKPQNLEKQD